MSVLKSILIFVVLLWVQEIDCESMIEYLVSRNFTHEPVAGNFQYYESNQELGIYKSVFVSESKYEIRYHHYSTGADTLFLGSEFFITPHKYDPLTFQVYKLEHSEASYLVLLSKSISASGSGNQVTYYSLVEMSKECKGVNLKSFSSRFGMIENLGDTNGDGEMDYLKIENGEELQTYDARIFDIKSNFNCSEDKIIKLNYLGDNLFEIKSSNWYFPIKCNE